MTQNEALKLAKDALDKALQEKKMSQEMVKSLGPAILDALKPSIEQMASNALLSREELLKAIAGIKINVPPTNIPEAKVTVSIPEIKVPTPQVTVNVPPIKLPDFKEIKLPVIKVPKPEVTVNFDASRIKIPDIKMPDEMNVAGWIGMMGYDKGFLTNPLPVQIRDSKGNPVNFGESSTQVMGGSGNARIVKVSGVLSTVGVVTINPDGDPTYSSGSSGLTDTELRATAVPVSQVSGSTWSVSVNDIFRTTVTSNLINADDRLRVSLETGGSGLTDAELRATAIPVSQLSGAIWSVFASLDTTVALYNADNRLRVSLETGGSGLTDAELRATPVPVQQVSGYSDSVNVTNVSIAVTQSGTWDEVGINDSGNSITVDVTDIFATTATSNVVNPDNRVKVELPTGSSGLTDTELRASAVPVSQVSGARWSTEATQGTSPWVVSATDLDIRDLVNASDSVSAYQVSGANWSVSVTNTVPVSATDLDIRDINVTQDEILVHQVSGSNWSVSVTNSITSTIVVGPTPADTADDGNAPIQVGGIARTANPTAVAANDVVKATFDDLGRQLVRHQVRDLQQSAYVQLTNGTETTLLAGVASTFHDLVWLIGANNSDAAVQVDLRSGTAGTVKITLEIPAYGTAGASLGADPAQQEVVAGTWTADMPDITGTTVSLSALFNKEV